MLACGECSMGDTWKLATQNTPLQGERFRGHDGDEREDRSESREGKQDLILVVYFGTSLMFSVTLHDYLIMAGGTGGTVLDRLHAC